MIYHWSLKYHLKLIWTSSFWTYYTHTHTHLKHRWEHNSQSPCENCSESKARVILKGSTKQSYTEVFVFWSLSFTRLQNLCSSSFDMTVLASVLMEEEQRCFKLSFTSLSWKSLPVPQLVPKPFIFTSRLIKHLPYILDYEHYITWYEHQEFLIA